MTTLKTCLKEAAAYWQSVSPSSATIMEVRARICVEIVGEPVRARALGVKDAAKLIKGLNDRGLSRKSVVDYFGAFKRMLDLNDERPKDYAKWPSPPKPPRKVRAPIGPGDFARMVARLNERDFCETADLALFLDALGGRVQREVLSGGNLRYRTRNGQILVHITGKGGHEREVPLRGKNAGAILRDRARYKAMVAIPYSTHRWRWNSVREELGLLTTFHKIRHKYATELLGKTKNLRLVQEALGHSNPATTAIYTHIGADEMVKAFQE